MDFGKAHTDAVIVAKRLRAKDPAKVKALAESMAEIGLQQPISVWSPDSTTCNLVAGYHRLLWTGPHDHFARHQRKVGRSQKGPRGQRILWDT